MEDNKEALVRKNRQLVLANAFYEMGLDFEVIDTMAKVSKDELLEYRKNTPVNKKNFLVNELGSLKDLDN